MRIQTGLFIVICFFSPGILPAEAPQKPSRTSLDLQLYQLESELFDWFDELGFPDLKGKKFVCITRQYTVFENKHEKTIESKSYGFLLNEDRKSFRIFTPNLKVETFEKLNSSCSVLDIEQEAPHLKSARESGGNRRDRSFETPFPLHSSSRRFVLARGFAANGYRDEAHNLLLDSYVCSSLIEEREYEAINEYKTIIQNRISSIVLHQNLLAFRDISVSRSELADRFREFVRNYPDSTYTDQAKEIITTLDLMVMEEDKRAMANPLTTKKKTQEDLIGDLIFQLRDQNGQYSLQIWSDSRDMPRHGQIPKNHEMSPASHLVAIGKPALPQLIEHLEDPAITRTIGDDELFAMPSLVTVGDCCIWIIERISRRSFSDFNARVRDGKIIKRSTLIKEWWEAEQNKP